MPTPKNEVDDMEDDFELLKDCFVTPGTATPPENVTLIESPARSNSVESANNVDLLSGDDQCQDDPPAGGEQNDRTEDVNPETVAVSDTIREPDAHGNSQEDLIDTTTPEDGEIPRRTESTESLSGSESVDSLMDLPLYVPPPVDVASTESDRGSSNTPSVAEPPQRSPTGGSSMRSMPSSSRLVAPASEESPASQAVAPIRGRIHTRPAWMTADLARPAPAPQVPVNNEAEIESMERQIFQVKQEVTELEQVIAEKKRQRDELRRQYAEMIQKSTPSPPLVRPSGATIVVELEKQAAAPLGLSVGFEGSYFFVNEVKSQGCVPEWNRQRMRSGGAIVEKGDRIVEVNGVRGDKDGMTREFRSPRIRLVVLKSGESPPSTSTPPRFDHTQWPTQSLDAYQEIIYGLRNAGHRDALPRTGIMKFGDVPVHVPDNGCFSCSVCRRDVGRAPRDWIDHFSSQEHMAIKEAIPSEDFWSRYTVEGGAHYWYEHKMGFWSLDDPNKLRTGIHTVS